MLERVTLQNQFYNIFAYAPVKGSTWSLVCGLTILSLIGGLIARRNDILVESLLRKKLTLGSVSCPYR